ncbi:MAG: type III pantothenate kinase [Spirochaetaceae bacterium]|nr:type III pantothenate kinase [Spirochaetaceae bacterium]
MQIVVKIGNTNTVIALYGAKHLVASKYIASVNLEAVWDDFVSSFVANYQAKITIALIASVVPAKTALIISNLKTQLNCPIKLVNNELFAKLPVKIAVSAEIGADLVANAVGGYNLGKLPFVVADFGTALSLTTVDKNAKAAGVVIAPGLNMAMQSLDGGTGLLSSVPLAWPQHILGRTTEESLQAGIVAGFGHLTQGLINDIEGELGEPCSIILTGGLAFLYKDKFKGSYEPNLAIDGLNAIALDLKNNN